MPLPWPSALTALTALTARTAYGAQRVSQGTILGTFACSLAPIKLCTGKTRSSGAVQSDTISCRQHWAVLPVYVAGVSFWVTLRTLSGNCAKSLGCYTRVVACACWHLACCFRQALPITAAHQGASFNPCVYTKAHACPPAAVPALSPNSPASDSLDSAPADQIIHISLTTSTPRSRLIFGPSCLKGEGFSLVKENHVLVHPFQVRFTLPKGPGPLLK